MPKTPNATPQASLSSLVARITDAISRHTAGESDSEGRTPLDDLVTEACHTIAENGWNEALLTVARITTPDHNEWWLAIEFFVVQAGLNPEGLAGILENIISQRLCTNAEARLSIYSLLAFMGKPPTATTLISDVEMRHSLPLQWLDLMIPVLPDVTERQKLILEAVRSRVFTIDRLAERLDELRLVGGGQLGDWLNTLRSAFPRVQWPNYDKITSRAFGLPINPTAHLDDPAALIPGSRRRRRARGSESADHHLAEERAWRRHIGQINKTKAASGRDVRELAPA
jgi:hypothetical protein